MKAIPLALLDHIIPCNRYDPALYITLRCAQYSIGSVPRVIAPQLLAINGAVISRPGVDALWIDPDLQESNARSVALEATLRQLDYKPIQELWSGEYFDIAPHFGSTPLFWIERCAITLLGLPGYGVHLNGVVVRPDGGTDMWIARRSQHDSLFGNQLDNIAAGGIGRGYGVRETLVKEAWEEAGISAEMMQAAYPVGMVTYRMGSEIGLRNEGLFIYDIQLPFDFEPINQDGEVASFERWPLEKVIENLANHLDFKFNASLVVIDYLLRNGILQPETIPDYEALIRGLRSA